MCLEHLQPENILVAFNKDGTCAVDHLDALRVCSDLNFVRGHLELEMGVREKQD